MNWIFKLFLHRYFPIYGTLVCVLVVFQPQSVEALDPFRVGIWVDAEGVHKPYDSEKSFSELQIFISNEIFTDVYCQVYRRGRAWFPSVNADDTPFRQAKAQGFDPLADTIKAAHSRGQKVHAWINALRIAQNKNAPLFQKLGRRAALVDNFGNSLFDYDSKGRPPSGKPKGWALGTPGIWLEPAIPEVRAHIVQTVKDLIIAYPELDGVHLDMIRMPHATMTRNGRATNALKFGYADEVKQSFSRYYSEINTGRSVSNKDNSKVDKRNMLSKKEAWVLWHQSQVTLLVFEIREMLKKHAPHIELSAAVFPYLNRAKLEVSQNWDSWMQAEIVDTLVPMAYSTRVNKVKKVSSQARKALPHGQMLVGIGAWLLKSKPNTFNRQIFAASETNADGIIVFSYSNLKDKRGKVIVNNLKKTIKSINIKTGR